MNVQIINDPSYRWTYNKIGNSEIYFKGVLWYDNKNYTSNFACSKLNEILSVNFNDTTNSVIKEKLLKLSGHFSFILCNLQFCIAFVDKIRSYPIYYYHSTEEIVLSNSAIKLQECKQLYDTNINSILEFKMAGYTLGNRTLFKKLYQLQPGESIIIDSNSKTIENHRYFRYFKGSIENKAKDELLSELHEATLTTFNKMIQTLNGRPVFIPLSGGLDSRLILTMLLELKYDKVVTYTYGVRGIWEIRRAKFIADKLKVPWHYVEFKPASTHKLFLTDDRKKYYNFASGFNSAPHLAEYYALLYLRRLKLIHDDAVLINGQSGDFTSGGHVPHIIRDYPENSKIKLDLLISLLIKKHFSLWINLKTDENIKSISDTVLDQLNLSVDGELDRDDFAKYYELLECEERQCKYVINGQRAYDWLGYDWCLPLWSDELIDFWLQVSWQHKLEQRLLKEYLITHNFQGVFNLSLPKQYSYFPFWVLLLKPIVFTICKVIKMDKDLFYQKYFKYVMAYSPYYPQQNYFQFLKDSQYHRHVTSYWVKYFLQELGIEENRLSCIQ